MPAWALQLVLFVGRIVLRVAMDKQLRQTVTTAIVTAEQQGGDGQQKMSKVLEQVKASGIQAVQQATEPELRSVIEMLLPKVVGKVNHG
ncbi:hypothetical protein C4K68_07715 [Pokkaliibacter plantistimulans]|uniref:Uncharacterized protein n=1 Tax=Proteobacteria bacterium 228 TaxID=2083153 RepID=A0A2S5KSV9_9PROT|nr:hypothetical protein [Pokkaliibacter plantistimulans]PPC77924.1 hypothetical protein C4K68_07715 [Pokkaliibacter plantistimulans]